MVFRTCFACHENGPRRAGHPQGRGGAHDSALTAVRKVPLSFFPLPAAEAAGSGKKESFWDPHLVQNHRSADTRSTGAMVRETHTVFQNCRTLQIVKVILSRALSYRLRALWHDAPRRESRHGVPC